METKKLIPSYNEKNDVFVGKIEGKEGYLSNFSINDNIFVNIDKYNVPSSIFIENASEVLNISKKDLKNGKIKIIFYCNPNEFSFDLFMDNHKTCSFKRTNDLEISDFNFVVDANY